MKKRIIIKILFIIVILLSIFGIIYSCSNIFSWFKDNKETESEVEMIFETTSIEESSEGEEVNPENKEEESEYWSYIKMNMISVSFDELKAKNSDTVGWIQVNGTNVNYPFVQTNDNEYYLTHSFEKKYTDAGWIFLDYRNDIDNLGRNTIIYGHARKDKTMFGTLKNTLNKDWYSNTDNHIIKLSTQSANTLWQIFSVYTIDTESYYITTNFSSDEEYESFISTMKSRSKYNFNTNVDSNDKIITLSTCYSNNKKLVVQAKLIKSETR